jgi:deoxyribonuclease V
MIRVWPSTPAELEALQRDLSKQTPPAWAPPSGPISVGGVVVCFPRGQTGPGAAGDPAWVAAATLRDGRIEAQAIVRGHAGAPYAAGLLALREGPCLEAAVRALPTPPDVLLVDATGRDHPRQAGLALHLGAVLDLPTIGVTHRPLCATGADPANDRGATAPLSLEQTQVAVWLRTRPGTRPLAIHPAWRTGINVAVETVMRACGPHRTPEPLRHARTLARSARARDRES